MEREPDFLCLATLVEPPFEIVLHLEVESFDRPDSDSRMLLYVAMDYRIFRMPVELYVIYLGMKEPRHLTGKVSFPGMEFRYQRHDMRTMGHRKFLDSDNPNEVILAVLANPEPLDAHQVVRLILLRLRGMVHDKKEFVGYLNKLKILSDLRNLRAVINEELEAMSLIDEIIRNIKEDELIKPILEESRQEALKKGLEEGLEKGLEKGRLLNIIQTIRRMQLKGLDAATISDFLGIEPAGVSKYYEQVKQWEEIRSLLRRPRATIKSVSKRLGVEPIVVEAVRWETNGKA